MTEQSISHNREKLQTAYQQGTITEFQNAEKPGTSLSRMNAMLNYNHVDKIGNDVAKTLCARDYKGFGTGFDAMNGVIEVMADVNVIGSLEAKFESTNRIYDVGGGVVRH